MRSATSSIRVGLVGYGLAARAFHAPLIAATDGLCLTAVVTRDPARRSELDTDHPGAVAIDDVHALLEPRDGTGPAVDLLVVASPNRTHVPLARAAIEAGVPVVVDKPLANTAREARELVGLSLQRRVPLIPFQNRRWDGDLLTVRRLLDEERLGRVLRFESRFDRWRPQLRDGWRERASAEEGGGLLLDLGAHLIDQALLLFGPARHVYAELDARRSGAEVEDDAFVAITHAAGVRSHLWMSAVAGHLAPRMRVLGSLGAYVKDGLDVQEARLRAGATADAQLGVEEQARWGALWEGEQQTPVPTVPGDYLAFYAGVRRVLVDGAAPPVDPQDAVRVLEVIEAARRSHRELRVVPLA